MTCSRKSRSANSLQTATVQVVREPGIYIIEGPMGYGKTEAALCGGVSTHRGGESDRAVFRVADTSDQQPDSSARAAIRRPDFR